MQYHFVVMYDEMTDTFEFDQGVTESRIGDSVAFDGSHWIENDELMEADYTDYVEMLQEKLNS